MRVTAIKGLLVGKKKVAEYEKEQLSAIELVETEYVFAEPFSGNLNSSESSIFESKEDAQKWAKGWFQVEIAHCEERLALLKSELERVLR